ncbi:MAG: hypothetical protein ACD_2C00025G0013 [uncultured bacterium (gcode 4)]|uniref:Restriction endonuclease type IV Mrr domain-containing protein n=1 Tax=uncultured bacterium (gcode 4) TaxID=1234023 RepID=K2G799_9BACT|nr:MAG: hypothetical protein ACD_2C00025G0013 [uncultured bacterium (gcode 4)]
MLHLIFLIFNHQCDKLIYNIIHFANMYVPYTRIMKEEYKNLLKFVKDKNDVRELIKIKYFLNYTWFEIYVTEFLKKDKYKFMTLHNGGMDDKWIDIKWIRKENWKTQYLIVQCKHWNDKHIQLDDVAAWYWKVVEHRIHENLFLVFATTSWFTDNAKQFCKDKEIYMLDYKEIIKMTKDWNFDDLEKFIKSTDNDYKKEDLFLPYYLKKLEWHEKNYIDKDEYLKQKIQAKRISISDRNSLKKSFFSKILELVWIT